VSTKLGPHVLWDAQYLSEYIQSGIAVAKFVGDWAMAGDVPDGVLVIGRLVADYDAQEQKANGQTPLEAAQQFVQDQLPTYQSNPHIEYWEGHNEPVWTDEEGMAWYAQFEVERMRLMADLGLKCVLGNFATGTPDLALWPAFLPALRVARQYQALLGLHEYSWPWMWWMTGRYQLNPNEDQGDEGWTTLRYRKIYRQHLIPNGLGDVPLAITECGVDPGVSPKPPGLDGGAWRLLGDLWAQHNNEPNKADYYFRQLVWYDEELQKDDYVVGATVFTWGNFGPPWLYFDVAGTEVARKLIAYTQADPAKPFVYPGVEEEEEEEEKPRGYPRVQYERTYVLLPPTADAAWARAVVESTWDQRRYTIGGSADDAGVGDLDVRRVIAINPQDWQGDQSLEEFYAEYYPGVEYRTITAATPEELAQKLASE
jgi:hypothetical protein